MFDFNNVKDFDRHIGLSIPSYENLTRIVRSISEYFLDPRCNVYDLGCSTGTLLKGIKKVPGVNYIGIDNSKLIPDNLLGSDIKFIKEDIFKVPITNACFITSIFTAQFTHRADRLKFFEKIKEGLNKNGAFIIAEKTYCNDGKVQDIVNSAYYEVKRDNFESSEILNKELELRQNLKPERYSILKSFLSDIGEVQEIWRCFNFVAFLVIKE